MSLSVAEARLVAARVIANVKAVSSPDRIGNITAASVILPSMAPPSKTPSELSGQKSTYQSSDRPQRPPSPDVFMVEDTRVASEHPISRQSSSAAKPAEPTVDRVEDLPPSSPPSSQVAIPMLNDQTQAAGPSGTHDAEAWSAPSFMRSRRDAGSRAK